MIMNGSQEIASSGWIIASGPTPETEDGNPIAVYQTSYSYQIPSTGTGTVSYEIRVNMNCDWLVAQADNTRILGENTSNISFFQSVINLLNSFLGRGGSASTQSVAQPVAPTLIPTQTKKDTFTPETAGLQPKSLKLGAFNPVTITNQQCDRMVIEVVYN